MFSSICFLLLYISLRESYFQLCIIIFTGNGLNSKLCEFHNLVIHCSLDPSPTNTGNIQLLNLGGGGGGAPVGAVESSSGSTLPVFSSSDPNNMTIPVIKSLYNIMS